VVVRERATDEPERLAAAWTERPDWAASAAVSTAVPNLAEAERWDALAADQPADALQAVAAQWERPE